MTTTKSKSSKNRQTASSSRTKKNSPAKNPVSASPWPRRVRLPAYKRFSLSVKRVKHPVKLPSAWKLTKKSAVLIWRRKWLFLSLAVVYGVLSIIFGGLSGGVDVTTLRSQMTQIVGGSTGQFAASIAVFTSLLSSTGSRASASAGAYQIFLTLIVSLAAIWTIRQLSAGNNVRLRDSFYLGMYPLVPFILVVLVIGLQCIPLLVGGTLYSLVTANGIAIGVFEKAIFILLFIGLSIMTFYMICSSLFAAYIVTLPDMTPLKALRSARQLVRFRRLSVFRKLLFLPIALFIIAALIMVPVIWFIAPAAQLIFFFLTMIGLIVIHAYMYVFYRELLA